MTPGAKRGARMRSVLLMFPPAGGPEASCLKGIEALQPHFDLSVAQYPDAETAFAGAVPIAELARHVVDTAVLPRGRDIIFFGYSYGARVAHEAAALFAERGCVSGLLVIGDVAVEYRANSLVARERWSAGRRGLARLAGPGSRTMLEMLVNMEPVHPVISDTWLMRLHVLAGMAMAQGRVSRRIQAIAQGALLRRQVRRWRPRHYSGRTLLAVTLANREINSDMGPDLGWRELCSDLTVALVPGAHHDFFLPPHLGALLAAMRDLTA